MINQARVIGGKPYPPVAREEFMLLPGVPEACRALKAAGFLLVVVTNQPDVGRGTLARAAVESIHAYMCELLPLDRVEVCYDAGGTQPPHPDRKPRPGMLRRAAAELGIDLARSFMVGDRWRDIDCGCNAGCTTILIDYGYDEPLRAQPDHRAANLLEAVRIIRGLAR